MKVLFLFSLAFALPPEWFASALRTVKPGSSEDVLASFKSAIKYAHSRKARTLFLDEYLGHLKDSHFTAADIQREKAELKSMNLDLEEINALNKDEHVEEQVSLDLLPH